MSVSTARSGIPPSRDELVSQLTRELTNGSLQPGDKLPSERQLAITYGVSRPVIREALQRLRERGLVHVAPGSGAYLRQPSALDWARSLDAVARHRAATTRQLVEARLMLESQAATLAAERATPEDVDALQRALEAFDRTPNVLERARCDIAFHSLIARASHNPVIEMMFGAIAPLVFEMMLRSLGDPAVTALGAPLHDTILAAIRAGDSAAAAAAAAEHVALAAEMFGADYDAQLDSIARRNDHNLFGAGTSLEEVIAAAIGEF